MSGGNLLELPGIGAKREKLFNRLGIYSVQDLLAYYPRGYEDRSVVTDIIDLIDGERMSIKGRPVSGMRNVRLPGGRSMQKLTVADESGKIDIIWFNQKYLPRSFELRREYIFYGKVKRRGRQIEMTDVVYEGAVEGEGESGLMRRIVPLYSLTAGVTQKMMQVAVRSAADRIKDIPEELPEWILKEYQLYGVERAIRNIHFPETFEDFEAARRRLAFEELFVLQLGLRMVKSWENQKKCPVISDVDYRSFEKRLSFSLTGAQRRAINEITEDFRRGAPMRRLVQGDVGCGKTMVAAAAIDIVRRSGGQAVMMVPTEILAEQHARTLRGLFGEDVELLCGRLSPKEKERVYGRARSGEAGIVVGTHALLYNKVEFNNLRLVITDEQHRFGVAQRKTLENKGEVPHLLVMTATPIPRTLAIVLYGDLDVSLIDEMPPGRRAVKTYAIGEDYRERINDFILKEVEKGRQVYILCPKVSDSGENEGVLEVVGDSTAASEKILKAVKEFSLEVQERFPRLRVGELHGKMRPREKEAVMREFAAGEIDVLVTTTVVEVGVDVANASLMVIENGEMFGLSQLHQLRGRVGRGEHQSYCVIFCDSKSEVAKRRMEAICHTCDGFKIAEEDLKLRGPGEFFGTRQHGVPELKIANLYQDIGLFKEAGRAVDEMEKRGVPEEVVDRVGEMLEYRFTS